MCSIVGPYKDYIAEAEKQIGGIIVYKDVNFKEKKLEDLSKTSNKQYYLEILRINRESHKKELKYFTLLKRPPILVNCICCLRFTNAYLISNCVTPTENVSEFLVSELKSVMQEG